MRASCRRVLLLAAGLPLLSACATPAQTPRELGLGVFEPLLGAEVRLRPQPIADGHLDAAAESGGGTQAAHVSIVPTGTAEAVLVAVGAVAHPGSHPVSGVGVAIYPLAPEATPAYELRGELPSDPPLLVAFSPEADPDGAVRLLAKLPRGEVPAGTRRLAIPVVIRFANGGIHVTYLHGVVPEPAYVASEGEPQPALTGEGQE
ncbi:MAG: hypothetical protein KDD82_21820 [Planctomycetes bacterium]|nr:hypothetical protein [Planctomycetota bacterium]